MTRKPNRSVAVAGPPAPVVLEAVGAEVVEVGLGEVDGDDMLSPSELKATGGEAQD